jgi:hypothetical protein
MVEIRCFGRIFFVSIFIFLNFLIILKLKLDILGVKLIFTKYINQKFAIYSTIQMI